MMNQPHHPILAFCATLAVPALLLVSLTVSARQQSPNSSTSATTNLGTLIVAPKNAPNSASAPRVNLRVQRRALHFNLGSQPNPSASPAQTTRHPVHGIKYLPPQPLHVFAPRYPTTALADHQQGTVTVTFTVQPDGGTTNIRIVSSEPSGIFDAAARTAVRHWLFDPATVDGVPVARQVSQTLVFRPPAKAEFETPAPQPGTARQTPANSVPDNIHPTHLVPPQYPPNAYRARQGGSVTLSFTVTPGGHTSQIRVLTSRPRYIFDRAAIEAVRQWRFKPIKTPTKVVQTIRFTPPR
jgi:protein TonB